MSAYNELYIDDASCNLAEYLDYMVIDLKYNIDEAFELFAFSKIGHSFETGNPSTVAGISGTEMARKLIHEIKGLWEDTQPTQTIDRSREYWVGWTLAQYQWSRDISFLKMIESGIKCSKLADSYILHEADITKTFEQLDIIIEKNANNNSLKRIRTYAQMTQRMLSEKSGVSLRMIQLYEQGQNDISHAQAKVVKDLARVLGCRMEDLI